MVKKNDRKANNKKEAQNFGYQWGIGSLRRPGKRDLTGQEKIKVSKDTCFSLTPFHCICQASNLFPLNHRYSDGMAELGSKDVITSLSCFHLCWLRECAFALSSIAPGLYYSLQISYKEAFFPWYPVPHLPLHLHTPGERISDWLATWFIAPLGAGKVVLEGENDFCNQKEKKKKRTRLIVDTLSAIRRNALSLPAGRATWLPAFPIRRPCGSRGGAFWGKRLSSLGQLDTFKM